jgi:hypothetical protein
VPFYLFVPSGPAGTEFRLALRSIGWEHRQTLITPRTSRHPPTASGGNM